jgi:aspartate/methionine/tyrosine aminotransferase
MLESIVSLASSRGIIIMADEVYRPLFHGISETPPSILSFGYDKTIATGSLSKAYSLAGIRTGWIAARDNSIIEACASTGHYTVLSVSQLDQAVAAYALSPQTRSGLLERNLALAKLNCQILAEFVAKHQDWCEWVRPVAGTTAMIKISRAGKAVDAVAEDRGDAASSGHGVWHRARRVCRLRSNWLRLRDSGLA